MFLNKRGAGPRLRTGGRVHTGSLPLFQLRKLLPPRKGSGSARKGGRAAPFSLSNCLHGRIIVYTKEAEHREEEEEWAGKRFPLWVSNDAKRTSKGFSTQPSCAPLTPRSLRNAPPSLFPATLNRNEL